MGRSAGVLGAPLLALLLTACQTSASDTVTEPVGTSASGFGAVFLGAGECSSFGTNSYTEVPCGGERAAARVVARHTGRPADGPLCPPTTDFVLHISEQASSSDEDADGTLPQGYACMRNLQPPHPGDPGAGGGPRTIVGDCVHGLTDGQVRETPCDGTGPARPQYKVTKAVATRKQCPATTALYVQLGGTDPVGCARRV